MKYLKQHKYDDDPLIRQRKSRIFAFLIPHTALPKMFTTNRHSVFSNRNQWADPIKLEQPSIATLRKHHISAPKNVLGSAFLPVRLF